ncbi:hypothetical protein CLU79DRAFT_773299 [Phycomyces nitens]|nr:hypothetical protein CLU79DRAFT_773299 [Phycomyces nitens]
MAKGYIKIKKNIQGIILTKKKLHTHKMNLAITDNGKKNSSEINYFSLFLCVFVCLSV